MTVGGGGVGGWDRWGVVDSYHGVGGGGKGLGIIS